VDALFEGAVAELLSYRPDVDFAVLERVYRWAAQVHEGQQRRSGDPYLIHPVETMRILLDLLRRRSDLTILAAALLHDTVEDSQEISLADLEREFGDEVAALVDGVTKISDLPFRSPEVTQTENYRKMLLSMAKDIRVILVKLSDRLHNMRTLDHLEEKRQHKIARETLDIYAPIAHRLGIARFKWELEDLAFKFLNPEAYRQMVQHVSEKRDEREKAIAEVAAPLRRRLEEEGIQTEVRGRPKHLWSIYQKMERLGAPFQEILDLLGLRVLTQSRDDCYRALGIVHDIFTPVPDRLKDYIATPKSNMYQSLHTMVTVPNKRRMIEVQIRTWEMHRISEIGIAAHYSYKEGQKGPEKEIQEKLGDFIVQGTTEWHADAGDPLEFMDFLRTSLYQDEVFVFTPRGGLKRLPRGATPIDFAYSIHSDVGDHCVGAKVNGQIVPLRHQLRSGQVVEVVTSPHAQPREDWLQNVASSRAKSKIRRFLTQERLDVSVRLGKEMLTRELKKRRLKLPPEKELEDISQSFGLPDMALLLAKVGQGDISLQSVMGRIHPEDTKEETKAAAALKRLRRLAQRSSMETPGLRIGDVEGLMIRIAKCCQPIPGDKVIGIISRGRGISVHRVDCPNTFANHIDPERRIEVSWDVARDQTFLVRLIVIGGDRANLLVDVASAISKLGMNMRHGAMSSTGDGEARGEFVLEVKNVRGLNRSVEAIRRVRGVKMVERSGSLVDPAELEDDG
jgi:GTP diphosphokinase / guanosine-3',5'-bis(diphosphate) 3'-diphosphatase